ncbi:VTT domain-containing protein [Edaphobacter aggregans]|uniref:VTT domain-containing protein n=1 Tax=Edaphobacter aggregans TaxID=570835 RepID=UPI000552CECE|nr:VTT domain-containing protein [Edaphobacter aggregans]
MTGAFELTYTGIGVAVFARQLCLPVPAIVILIAAGALSGHNHLNPAIVVLAGILGCLGGDGVWFWLGRHWGNRVVRMICRLTSDPRGSYAKANKLFQRWGLRVLLVAKFIPVVDGVSPPLAGAEGVTVQRFLLFDAGGGFLWSAAYVLLGVVFADQLDRVIDAAQRLGTILGVLIGVPLLSYIVWRAFVLVQMMRYLKRHRITPALLNRRLEAGEKIAVIDLLGLEDGTEQAPGIPGAVRLDPVGLRGTRHMTVPDDVSMVLYCSSRDQFTSARVAVALRRRGAKRVWILDGGLKGWQDQGFSVTTELSTPQQVAARLGIDLRLSRNGASAAPAPGDSTNQSAY